MWCIATAAGASSVWTDRAADARADAAVWAAGCARAPALAVETRMIEPLRDRNGPNGTIEIRRTLAWGWPPRLRVDQAVQARPERMPPTPDGRPAANPPRLSVFWATSAGETIDVQRDFSGRGGGFTRSSFEPTRKAAIVDAWTESPMLLGRMIFEETRGAADRFTEVEDGVAVTVAGVPVVLRMQGPDRLAAVRFERPGGGVVIAEYAAFAAAPAPLATGVLLPGEVRWTLAPVMKPGARLESGDHIRTVEVKLAKVVVPSAETFLPDLVGLTSTDPLSGEVRDASGAVLAVIPPRAAALSWLWLGVAGAMGAAVLAGGVRVWRRRMA